MKKQLANYFLLLVAFLFLVTRVINLGSFPLFVDEAFYVKFCDQFSGKPADFLFSLKYNTQPLFIWLSLIFFKTFKEPILATRLVSVFTGFLNLVTLFFLVKRFFPQVNKFFPLFFYLFLPFNLLYDRLALLESLTLWAISFSVFLSLRLIEKPNFLNSLLLSFAFLLTGLTKQIALFGIILSFVLAGDYFFTSKKKSQERRLAFFFSLSGLLGLSVFMAISLLSLGSFSNLWRHFISIPGEHFMAGEQRSLGMIFKTSKLNFFKLVLWLRAYLKTPIFIFTFLSLIWGLVNVKKRVWRRLLIWIAVVVLFEVPLTTIFYPRHLLPITIPIIILNSLMLTRVAKKSRIKTIFLVLLLFFPCLQFGHQLLTEPEKASFALEDRFQYFEDWTSGKGYDEVARFLQNKADDKKLVVYTEPYNLSLVSLKFHSSLKEKEIVFFQEEWLRDPIKVKPAQLFKIKEGEEKYIIRNRNPGLPKDWPVELVKEIPKSSFRKIEIYQVIKIN